jgi:hypothetical protein
MKTYLAVSLSLILTIIGCKNATENSDSPKGEISGKVVYWNTDISPNRSASLSLLKRNISTLYFDSIRTVISDSGSRYAFASLDTGEYFIRPNVDSYFKGGYIEYAHLTAESFHRILNISIDTVGRIVKYP